LSSCVVELLDSGTFRLAGLACEIGRILNEERRKEITDCVEFPGVGRIGLGFAVMFAEVRTIVVVCDASTGNGNLVPTGRENLTVRTDDSGANGAAELNGSTGRGVGRGHAKFGEGWRAIGVAEDLLEEPLSLGLPVIGRGFRDIWRVFEIEKQVGMMEGSGNVEARFVVVEGMQFAAIDIDDLFSLLLGDGVGILCGKGLGESLFEALFSS
jgi:hypothetical protein